MKRSKTVFEESIQKVRTIKNSILAIAILGFLGFHGAVGYSLYSLYTGNNFQGQLNSLEADISLTFVPTNIGQFLFDELNFSGQLGTFRTNLTQLIDLMMNGMGGENQTEPPLNQSTIQSADGEPELPPELQNMPAIMVAGLMAFNYLFTGIMNLSQDPAFLAKMNDTNVHTQYNLTAENLTLIESGNIDGSHLLEAVNVDVVIPFAINNPSFLTIDPGNMSISLSNATTGGSKQLITLSVPKLQGGQNANVSIPIGLVIPGKLFAANQTGDMISTIFGDLTTLTIEFTSSILVLYPISMKASVNLEGLGSMGDNQTQNGGGQ